MSNETRASQNPRFLLKLLALFFMLQKATNNILYLSLLTVFLRKAGIANLPWIYVFVNLFFITFQLSMTKKLAAIEGYRLLSAVSLPIVFFSIGSGLLIDIQSIPLTITCFVTACLIDLFTNQAFAAMANQVLTLQESKQGLPFVYACGSGGYILSGILLKFVIDFVGLRGLLWLNALLLLISQFFLHEIGKSESANTLQTPHQPESTHSEPVESSFKQPLARLLIFSSFVILFNKYLVDFLFSDSTSTYFRSSTDLAAFLGIFGAITDLVVMGLQTTVMNVIFSRFPIGRVLMITPAILSFLCIAAFCDISFPLVVIIQFIVLLSSKNFSVPATTILLGAIPQNARLHYRRDIAITSSLASLFVGVALIFLRAHFSIASLFGVAAIICLITTIVHYHIDAAYSHTLKTTLSTMVPSDDLDLIQSLRFLDRRERIQRLQDLLAHPDPQMRLEFLTEVSLLPTEEIRILLIPRFSKEHNPQCLARSAKIALEKLGPEALSHLESLLKESRNQRLIADILEALGTAGSGEQVELLIEEYIVHENHRIRSTALMSLLRVSRDQIRLELALSSLVEMARATEALTRASAAAVMGELAFPLFVPALEILTMDGDEIVVKNSITALSKVRTSKALNALENLFSHEIPRIAKMAKDMYNQASRESVKRIGYLAKCLPSQERHLLVQSLKSLHGEGPLELLGKILALEKPEIREGLIRLLQHADFETLELLDQCLLVDADRQTRPCLAPLWRKAVQTYLVSLPTWSELIQILGKQETDADETMPCSEGLDELINRLWLEAIALEQALKLGFLKSDKEIEQMQATWHKRSGLCCRLFAMRYEDPLPMLAAMEQIQCSNSFTRSIAQEFIETKFGNKTATMLLPLLQKMRQENNITELAEKLSICKPEKMQTEKLKEVFTWLKEAQEMIYPKTRAIRAHFGYPRHPWAI